MFLLDISTLIALADERHIHHRRTHAWFFAAPHRPWATCPLTENGFVRVVGHSFYPDFEGGTTGARAILRQMCLAPGHQFWPDALSIRLIAPDSPLPSSRHLTDFYLLALAIHRHAQFATLDEDIDARLLPNGEAAYLVIP